MDGGERIVAPTRRADGSLRKAIRIRAGYVPQDEVALYQSKASSLKNNDSESSIPGFAPLINPDSSLKSSKRNGRTKGNTPPLCVVENDKNKAMSCGGDKNGHGISTGEMSRETGLVGSVVPLFTDLSISEIYEEGTSLSKDGEESNERDLIHEIDKRIRSLKKKIRLIEEVLRSGRDKDEMNPEQLNKISKLGDFQMELKILEDRKSAGILH